MINSAKSGAGISRITLRSIRATGAMSFAREVAHPGRTALRRPAPRGPIFDQPQIAYHLFEPLGLAHRRVGRMPEPCGGDRLEIAAADLVLVEFQHALRRPHMHVGAPE